MAAPSTTSGRPELKVAETWDMCIENTIRKLAYGALTGGLAAMILFRTPAARSACFGIGAGIGVGMGYTDCKYTFDCIAKEQSA
ncbi:hypothetical protein AB1Y20_018536 [Prymnesium parvum]|uniref:MICOS complex subunit MIC10 n=1 Tax=Prymnesium parvum TaxID=97485 RepID=A0AB34JSK5_PRYPA